MKGEEGKQKPSTDSLLLRFLQSGAEKGGILCHTDGTINYLVCFLPHSVRCQESIVIVTVAVCADDESQLSHTYA